MGEAESPEPGVDDELDELREVAAASHETMLDLNLQGRAVPLETNMMPKDMLADLMKASERAVRYGAPTITKEQTMDPNFDRTQMRRDYDSMMARATAAESKEKDSRQNKEKKEKKPGATK